MNVRASIDLVDFVFGNGSRDRSFAPDATSAKNKEMHNVMIPILRGIIFMCLFMRLMTQTQRLSLLEARIATATRWLCLLLVRPLDLNHLFYSLSRGAWPAARNKPRAQGQTDRAGQNKSRPAKYLLT